VGFQPTVDANQPLFLLDWDLDQPKEVQKDHHLEQLNSKKGEEMAVEGEGLDFDGAIQKQLWLWHGALKEMSFVTAHAYEHAPVLYHVLVLKVPYIIHVSHSLEFCPLKKRLTFWKIANINITVKGRTKAKESTLLIHISHALEFSLSKRLTFWKIASLNFQ